MRNSLLLAIIVPVIGIAQPWSGIVSTSRAIDWSLVGVVGGVPSGAWIQCGSTLSASSTAAQINTAISTCGTNQYVQLGSGTFTLSTGLVLKSNMAVRGMGADQTFLVFSDHDSCHGGQADICMASSDTNYSGGPSNTANWTSGYSQGTASIVLSSHTNLKVGAPLILDQLDDASDTATKFVCQDTATSPPCSLEGNVGNGQRTNRDQVQIVTVAACGTSTPGASCTSNTITISPGLYDDNWVSGNSPAAWWATSPIFSAGIENLSLDHTNSAGAKGIEIFNCSGCWVSGIRSIDSGKAHVEDSLTVHTTVQNSYFYLTQNAVSQSYGISPLTASDALYVNNISQYIVAAWLINGACSGCVVAYNYNINNFYTGSSGYNALSTSQHTAGVELMLYEGNIGSGESADNFHGTHNLVTLFRNYWIGTQPACWISGSYPAATFGACTSNRVASILYAYSRLYNLIGNVLGSSTANGYESGTVPIYSLGQGNTEGSVTVPSDSLVKTTLMRWGNYDTVTGAVRWCGNSSDTGWSTTCASTSEVPTGLSLYANAVPASETLPASFYLSSKPSWWPSSKAWPPIGPDVSGGNISGVGGHAFTIPAQDCFLNTMGGPSDGTGPVLSFNAATCYSGSTTGSTALFKSTFVGPVTIK